MDYTWEQVLNEQVPQTMYSFTEMERIGRKKRERREELEQQMEDQK